MARTNKRVKEREDWLSLLQNLFKEIKSWAEEENWSIHEDRTTIREKEIGEYDAPFLVIVAGTTRIHVEPVGREIVGAEGRVDISAFPTMNRMVLVRTKSKWVLKTDSYVEWPLPWSKDSFLGLVKALAA